MFFQIHKDGQAVDGGSYHSLEEACAVVEKAEHGGEVTEVDAFDKIVRRYTLRSAVRQRASFATQWPTKPASATSRTPSTISRPCSTNEEASLKIARWRGPVPHCQGASSGC